MITFWSRSKNQNHKYLSNFELIPDGILIDDEFFITYMRGRCFPSIENAFQACKYAFSDNPCAMSDLETCSPKEAKSAGSKTGMMKKKTKLDVVMWNNVSYECMFELLNIRYHSDERFKCIIDEAKIKGEKFYHIEPRGPRLWGGCMKDGQWVGQNRLGKILDVLN